MKKCPNCGVQLNDDCLFCTECGNPIPQGDVCPQCGAIINEGSVFCENCGKRLDETKSDSQAETISENTQKKCPHCGTLVNDDDVFCENCGKRLDETKSDSQAETISENTQKKCPHCGTLVNDDDVFCENCGKNLTDAGTTFAANQVQQQPIYEVEERSSNGTKIIIPIIIVLVVLFLIGGGWFGYNKYSEYSAAKQAREKFVADSLEQARKDSIKLADQLEKERQDSIENARLLSLQEPYLSLLDIYSARNDDEHWGEFYFLYDLNGDEFPELWLQVLENEDFQLLVYSSIDGVAKLLFRGDVGHPYHHGFYKGDDYILMNFAHMGAQSIYKYYLENGLIKEENIFTLEADSLNEAEYKEISEPEISTYEITDKSPIYEIK